MMIIVHPRWMCMRTVRFSGMNLLAIESESDAMEYRDMVNGNKAIWNNIACIAPNSNEVPMTLNKYLGESSGTM